MKTVVIFSYSRADLLKDCIESVLTATDSSNWKKILVWQQGKKDVEEIVNKNKNFFDLTIITNGLEKTTLGNINFNRALGTSTAFNMFNSELVLGLEEDTVLSKDALVFCEFAINKFGRNRFFRGINLGSVEPRDPELENSFSLIRYACVSQASAITSKTWKKIKLNNLLKEIDKEGWDSRYERVTKTGFMVTPNNSRSLDRGWGGSHAPNNPEHKSFVGQRLSFVDNYENKGNWQLKQIKHNMRYDSIEFKVRHQLLFRVRYTRLGDHLAKLLKAKGSRELFKAFKLSK